MGWIRKKIKEMWNEPTKSTVDGQVLELEVPDLRSIMHGMKRGKKKDEYRENTTDVIGNEGNATMDVIKTVGLQ